MKVYHGTTTEAWIDIQREGLLAGAHVTDEIDIAWYYAEAAFDEIIDPEEDDDYLVIELDVAVDDLAADWEAVSEPVWAGTSRRISRDEINDRVSAIRELSGADTLEIVCSARLRNPVDSSRLRQTC